MGLFLVFFCPLCTLISTYELLFMLLWSTRKERQHKASQFSAFVILVLSNYCLADESVAQPSEALDKGTVSANREVSSNKLKRYLKERDRHVLQLLAQEHVYSLFVYTSRWHRNGAIQRGGWDAPFLNHLSTDSVTAHCTSNQSLLHLVELHQYKSGQNLAL